jgi:alkanesulfonate monooxygenase SsuD/methylene tetrahydromethanopterin reductase-like flavin-dependent oxidoreductase (luciferase family)
VQLYRNAFKPSEVLREPYVMLGVAVVAADTDERARWLAGPSGLSFLSLRRGRPTALPTPEEAAEYPYTEMDRLFVEDRFQSSIIGSPETVHKGLQTLLDDTGADELMITTMVHGNEDRLHSYDLVAQLTH